jgi:hypothetical protein
MSVENVEVLRASRGTGARAPTDSSTSNVTWHHFALQSRPFMKLLLVLRDPASCSFLTDVTVQAVVLYRIQTTRHHIHGLHETSMLGINGSVGTLFP